MNDLFLLGKVFILAPKNSHIVIEVVNLRLFSITALSD